MIMALPSAELGAAAGRTSGCRTESTLPSALQEVVHRRTPAADEGAAPPSTEKREERNRALLIIFLQMNLVSQWT
jgi:hypothetical protein